MFPSIKTASLITFAASFGTCALSRDFRPAWHIENVPLTDSSIQQCYVIQTLPGIEYTFESSNDLGTWAKQDEFYGLGNEYVVTMREFTPPPPPPPGTPPPTPPTPAINVSLRLQPVSGEAGGSVVAWRSLDHNGPMIHRLAGEMDPGWILIPLFFHRFDDYAFFVSHLSPVATPPLSPAILGPQDSAMIAALEANLSALNLQVAEAIIRSRNAPPPAPPDPNGRRFWRVKVDASIDTDLDGSPDWAEFEIASRGTGMIIPGVTGDAFNADTNGDNIPDGQQLDADLDGSPDATDPDSTDNTTVVPLGPIPRYATFETPGKAIQINDRGTVIFPEKVWKNGVSFDLPGGASNAPSASARGINDVDVILGTANRDPGSNHPGFLPGRICYWPAPNLPYQYVEVVENGETVQAYVHHDSVKIQGPAPILSASGQFIAKGYVEQPEPDYTDAFDGAATLWQIPASGTSASRQIAPAHSAYLASANLIWGGSGPGDNANPGAVHAPGTLPSLPFVPFNVIAQVLPNGGATLFATSGLPDPFNEGSGTQATLVYDGQNWRPNATYANAVDIAEDGIAIGRSLPDMAAPILVNGKWIGIDRAAPGLPAPWQDPTVTLRDTTPGGWILAHCGHGNVESPNQSAALLPIRVEGVPPSPLSPEASGVDAYSIGSPTPGDAVAERIWIMAPAGAGSNEIVIKSPIHSSAPLKLSAAGIKFGGANSITVTEKITTFLVTASNPAASGSDLSLKIELGTQLSTSEPIGVKIMKSRMVKVTVHPVVSIGGDREPNGPDLVPSKIALEAYLHKIYHPQVNATFIVTLKDPEELDWDNATASDFPGTDPKNLVVSGNGYLDFLGDSPRKEENTIDNLLKDDNAEINIYILGRGRTNPMINWENELRRPYPFGAYGFARPDQNIIFIDGDIGWFNFLANRDSGAELLHAIAHEIGHCIVGSGHPDEGKGNAPLPGLFPPASVNERLMVSGDKTRRPNFGCRLVKREWDDAEVWLRSNVDPLSP